MLKNLLIYNGVCFGLSILLLVLFGHRVKRGHWALSIIYLITLAYVSRFILHFFDMSSPSNGVILAELLIGIGIIAMNEDWNLFGHVTFWSLMMAVGSFLAFASYITFFSHLGPFSLTLSLLLLLLQALTMTLMIAHTYEILDVSCRTMWRYVVEPQPSNDYFPKVSLHVPAYNEPPEMVKATLSALAQLDYPNYEVIMVDDNTKDDTLWRPVEEHCKKLGFKFYHLENWPGYKSGALNFALSKIDSEAEIVGVVDSDYIVEPKFLRDLVGLFRDGMIAFVQTPQDYRDFERTDTYAKACYDAYRYFFRVSMATRNEHNAIIFAGTMGLVRRQVLEKVGGWDEWCITEDAELSLRILNEGYRGLYVDKTYGRGLMPLDYDGLKKQRFRWAFGGMQILRMHIRKLIPTWMGGDSESRLTWPQKFAYLSGGLQWLNDPLNFIFTALLLTGVGALVSGGSLIIQPMVGFVVIMPATFVLFGLLRFLWALRIRLRCSWIEAYRALTILLGLIWVVTLACVQGLTRRQGVFLRTPKKKGDAGLISGFRIVRWELGLSAICACGMGALILGDVPKIPRLFLIALSGWQSFIYSSAVQSWLWSYQSEKLKGPQLMPIPFRTAGHLVGRFVGESISAVHVVLGLVLFGILLWVSAIKATEMERIFSILPDYSYLTKLTKHPAPIEIKAIIYQEGDAALKADVDQAVSLWSQDGFIHDMNFTPDNPLDDRIWKGKKAIRERYKEEFTLRSYLRLAHQNISVVIDGDKANAQNDLMAVIKTERDIEQVLLQRSDKWSFRKDRSEWKILSLTVNRIEIKPK